MQPLDRRPCAAELLTVAQVAEELNVGEHVIRVLLASGELPFMRTGSGSYHTERLLLEQWIRTQYRATAAFVAENRFPSRAHQDAAPGVAGTRDFLTVQDVMAELEIPRSAAYRLLRSGGLGAVKTAPHHAWQASRAGLEAYRRRLKADQPGEL